ncbi:MAG: GNAT family N-acetyltransferase [Lachnospiraceae bacterium]|nr:GNAT family N-acetyltransferase [Lachnospiraceae bacterium]
MFIKEKEFTLKNGQKVILRSPFESEAKVLNDHKYLTSGETNFLARYPEEVVTKEEITRKLISIVNKDDRDFFLSAFVDGKLIADSGTMKLRNNLKYRHRGYFGVSILQAYCDLGLGSIILQESIRHAKENGFEQLELGVFEDNYRAIHVYEKAGFQKVGVQPRAFKLKDGTYRDEVQMVLFL